MRLEQAICEALGLRYVTHLRLDLEVNQKPTVEATILVSADDEDELTEVFRRFEIEAREVAR
jgi:hypothetical protein